MNGERDFGRGNLLAALSMARIISASLAWAESRITLALLVPRLTTTSPISVSCLRVPSTRRTREAQLMPWMGRLSDRFSPLRDFLS